MQKQKAEIERELAVGSRQWAAKNKIGKLGKQKTEI